MDASRPVVHELWHWSPSRNSVAALCTVLGMIAAYAILGTNSGNLGIAALIGLVVVPVLAVGIPVYWTTRVERQSLAALGITTHLWFASLLIGIALSLLELAPLALAAPVVPAPERWLPMAAAGAVALFEPLFVFGWLQLRFEKDFGVLPAIILAALCFALYHVGYLPGAMGGQFTSAVVYAVFFRLTSNLLVTWPLLWAASSARICIGSNICFANWGMVSGSAMAFIIEVAFIVWMGLAQALPTRPRPQAVLHR